MFTQGLRRVCAAGFACSLAVSPLSAETLPGATASPLAGAIVSGDPQWSLDLTPYVWATGLKGRFSPFEQAPTIDVEKSFTDVMDELRVGGFLSLWARRGAVVFTGDLMYVSTRGGQAAGPLPAFQLPELGVAIPSGAEVEARVDSRQFTGSLLGGYRVVDRPDFKLDALAGARAWHIHTNVKVSVDHPLIGRHSAQHSESYGWVDPMLGARAFFSLSDRLSVVGQADIGGFGVGSRLGWSAFVAANYGLSDRFSLSLGYKVMDVDYRRNGHVFDVRMQGPAVGLTYQF